MSKKFTKKLQKSISTMVMITTIVWMSGIAMIAPVATTVVADERPSVTVEGITVYDGDLISSNATNSDGSPTYASLDIYIAKVVSATETYKRLVLNPQVFDSYGHLNWGDVQEVSQSVMDAFTTSCLTREDGDTKVYAMAPDDDTGIKSWINLTGTEFTDATVGSYSANTSGAIYTINSTDAGSYTAANDIDTVTVFESYLTDGTMPPVPDGDLTVGLSGDTPASSTLIAGQAIADLAHFVYSGTGTVNNVTLKRIGVSANATASSVYLFDGDTRITDAASFSSNSTLSFNSASGLFTVDGSKTISVKSNIAASTSGETIGVELTSTTDASGSVISGSTPIAGNIHSIASATLATVAMSSATGSGNVDPGNDILVWQGTATVGTRNVLLTRLALRQIGSIVSSDIENFRLLVDGTEVATQDSLDANGYVTFSPSQSMSTGARVIKVHADVIGGSGRTVQVSLRGAYDITVVDTQYNANSLATGTFPFGPSAFTVNPGTMSVVKASNSQAGNITTGASDVSFATFDMTAYGEAIKVETLTVDIDQTGAVDADVDFQNVKVMVDGSQVGSTRDVTADPNVSFNTNFTVTPGTPVQVEIRGDVIDNDITTGTNEDDISAGTVATLTAKLAAGSGNAIPQVSLGTIGVPTAVASGNALTIATGSITLAKTSNYGDQTVVVPQTAYKLGSFQLLGNSTEAVNLNTIEIDFTSSGVDFDASDDLTDLYVMYGGNQTSIKGTVLDIDNTWSISHTLAVNETMQVDVYANIGSAATTHTLSADLTVTGVTASSATTVYADSVDNSTTKDAGETGQVITPGTGSIAATKDASSPSSAIVDDSGTVTTAAFKFTTTNDAYTVTDITFTLADGSAVQNVIIRKQGETSPVTGGTKPGATGAITFSGLSIPVNANASQVIEVDLEMGSVGIGAGTTNSSLLTTLTLATARNSQGVSSANNVMNQILLEMLCMSTKLFQL